MSVLYLLIPLSILLAAGFLGAFLWAVRSGQFDDTATPSLRVLTEECDEAAHRSNPRDLSKPTTTKS